MKEYHKIQTIYKRDMTNKGKIIIGEYSLPEFECLKDCQWVFTEKVDGTNIRVIWDGKNIVFGGKTDKAQIPVKLLYVLQSLFEGTTNKQKMIDIFGTEDNICLYGEGYGESIQKDGKNYIQDGVGFVLFDVKIGNWWLERNNIEDIAKKLGLKVVPIIGEGNLSKMVNLVENGFLSQWGNFIAEGIVAKPKTELFTRKGERIITKIKHKDFIN